MNAIDIEAARASATDATIVATFTLTRPLAFDALTSPTCPLPVRTGGVSLVHARTRSRQFVCARPSVSRDVQAGAVVRPIDEPVLEDGVGASDALRDRHDVADVPRRLRTPREVGDRKSTRLNSSH